MSFEIQADVKKNSSAPLLHLPIETVSSKGGGGGGGRGSGVGSGDPSNTSIVLCSRPLPPPLSFSSSPPPSHRTALYPPGRSEANTGLI